MGSSAKACSSAANSVQIVSQGQKGQYLQEKGGSSGAVVKAAMVTLPHGAPLAASPSRGRS